MASDGGLLARTGGLRLTSHNRRGYFWGDRFKSVIVENGETLVNCLAYIDLNPSRAGVRQGELFKLKLVLLTNLYSRLLSMKSISIVLDYLTEFTLL